MSATATTIVGTEYQPCLKHGLRFCNGKQYHEGDDDNYSECDCPPDTEIQMDTSDEIGIKIIEALGLPPHVRKIELIFEANLPVVVKVEYSLDSTAKLENPLSEFGEYEIRKK